MMNTSTSYHIGGYLPDAPAQNKASEANPDTGTWTEWDEAGKITVERKLTPDEIAALTPPADPTPAPQTVTIDPATIAAIRVKAAKSTSGANAQATLLALCDALLANDGS